MEAGKLFIGGISWDTNEERLREYFQSFGEVVEAVIMKDRTTGRARGFGFIVFSDPTVAERVVKQKHMIDGRAVEAKKAVPRDDQQRSSPRTKKIFVGGLGSTVTESEFKKYFDQFGTTTDVVVMYDHNTQRPRGFGFITYDSEESVDKVLLKTFHQLNGKMVEVKRAVPKDSSPGPNRTSNITGYNYGFARLSNSYAHPSSLGGFGIRVDDRFSPVTVGRTFSYNMGPNSDSILSTKYGGNGSSLGYERVTPNRFAAPIGYGMGGGGGGDGNASGLKSINSSMWGNGNQTDFLSLGNNLDSFGAIWGNPSSGNGVNAIGYGRNSGSNIAYGAADNGGASFYTDTTWRSSSPDLQLPSLFSYGFGSDAIQKKPVGYSVANRGIAA